ncbi:MAG: methylamine utilization protein [Gammaproteobacteria bacterium]|nr:methylamine utilization protein [Gammaproteobacteria bacterium]
MNISKFIHALVQLLIVIMSFDSGAEQLNIAVKDQDGQPLSDVVVSVYPENPHVEAMPDTVSNSPVIIDQIKKTFVNHVTPVQVGTAVSFPNHDQIRHHVYSFSPAKTFEIPLYKGLPTEPIVFDREGVVSLGCNIHDWMSAYVVVVDTPLFSKTDNDGKADLAVPTGDYSIRFWHRDMDSDNQIQTEHISIAPDTDQSMTYEVHVKPDRFSSPSSVSIFNRGFYR